jgi:DNA-binding transcriptional MerR regulator
MRRHDFDPGRSEVLEANSTAIRSIHTLRFDTKDVARVSGVDIGKLQNWLTRGVIQTESELNPGRGQSRAYSAYEVARIRLMKKLADTGVPLSTAFKLTSALKKAWEQVPGGHELYGLEPAIQSWLLVLPAAEWPTGRKASMVQTDDYVAVWLVDTKQVPDSPAGLRATLAALGDAAVVVINMGAFLKETLSPLSALREVPT